MHSEKIQQCLAIYDGIPVPTFILAPDNEGNIVYAGFNEAALKKTRFTNSDYLGLTASQVFHGHYGKTMGEFHQKAYQSGAACSYDVTLPLNGKIMHIRTHLKPYIDEQGRVAHIIGCSQEISAEHELAVAKDQSKALSDELQDFIYLAAHDMRSPMRRIAMLADLVREEFQDLGDGKLEAVDMMEQVSVEALSMVNKVLEHAQTSSMEESIDYQHLPEICTDIVAILDPLTQHEYAFEECYFRGDCVLLKIVLRNLIDNSIKHNPDTKKALKITVSANETRSGFCSFTVQDNGIGMPNPHTLLRSENRQYSKSGFGLLAIRKLLTSRGGDIIAASVDNGRGLSVTFYAPGSIYPSPQYKVQ